MKYIDAERLKTEIRHLKIDVYDEAHQFDIGARSSLTFLESFIDSLQQEQGLIVINKKDWEAQEQFQKNQDFGKPLQQEQPNKESLNESQQEFVNIVTERMLKEGPIPTLKGKQKAEFEKEFNRFKQITGMINFPAHMEIYKKIILWFMAWGADNLQNLNKATDSDELDFQQEQPEVDLEKEYKEYVEDDPVFSILTNRNVGFAIANHFYELGLKSK
jgi:hypothetical protein